MSGLRTGPGRVLVGLVTSGARLTEIAFRGYALTRLRGSPRRPRPDGFCTAMLDATGVAA